MRARTLVSYALVAGFAILAAGCTNPFQPATPQAPTSGGVPEDFTTTAKLLDTMAAAVSAKGTSGRLAYIDALADSSGPTTPEFYAIHDPAVVDAWVVSTKRNPDIWDLTLKKTFFDDLMLVRQTFNYAFTWSKDLSGSQPDIEDDGAGVAVLHRHYTLIASSVPDGAIENLIAVGNADLYLKKVTGRWVLYRWEDRVDPQYGLNPPNDERSMGYRRLDSTTHHQ